jgi:drug/metabolite transporter (DMT)-like permease
VPPAPSLDARAFAPRDAALLLGLSGMWGLSFLFIEVALRGLSPLWIVAGRTFVGAAFLHVVLRFARQPLPRSASLWGHLALLGVLANALPWGAIAWAQQAIPSALAGILMALVPTSTLALSVVSGQERLTVSRGVGLLLALAGVGAAVADGLSETGRVAATVVMVAVTLVNAVGAVYAKRFVSGRATPLTIATGQVSCAALVSLVGALLLSPLPTSSALAPTVVASVAALGALGTGVAFLAFYVLIERVGATNATLVTYLIPLVAVIAGVLLLGEQLTPQVLTGGALIVAGIWLTQRGSSGPHFEGLK